MPKDAAQRRDLVASGGLKIIQVSFSFTLLWGAAATLIVLLYHQSVDKTQDAEVAHLIDGINSNYPAEVVEYCSPGFSDTLADRL